MRIGVERRLAGERAPAADLSRWLVLSSYVLILLVALLPRVLDLGQFITVDEIRHWIPRSQGFLDALRSGDYAATAPTEHPGVTTMWLGTLGILLRNGLRARGLVGSSDEALFALMQTPPAILHTLAILLGYWLLRRMVAAPAALLGALLWATDPFVVAFSRVLHVDALMGTFATLSLLAACSYWWHEPRRATLVLSGVCAGLAMLTKTPALALLPVVFCLALVAEVKRQNISFAPFFPRLLISTAFLRAWLLPLLIWGAVCGATVFALWPALWVRPASAYEALRGSMTDEGDQEKGNGNFFLGRADTAPGPTFYPVAIALRLTPWAMLGLLALPLALRHASPAQRRDIATLIGFVLLFTLMMSIFPKKLNRYIEPAFPALDLLAAFALAALVDARARLSAPGESRVPARPRASALLIGIVAVVAIVNIGWWYRYSVAYFNPLLGGARVGAQTFIAGWGEGYDQLADWLNQRDDIRNVRVASPTPEMLRPFMRSKTKTINTSQAQPDDYIIVYLRQTQGPLRVPLDQFYGKATPLHIISIHGVAYAWIYRVPEQP